MTPGNDVDTARAGISNDGQHGRVLSRLNARGIRILQAADFLGLFALMILTNLVRYGLTWPAYGPAGGPGASRGNIPTYLVAFALWASLHVVIAYFMGLYEREPRLGAPPVLPKTVRSSAAATVLIMVIGFVTTRSLLPAPLINLLVLLFLGSMVMAANRRITHLARLRREGPPRVVIVGAPDDLRVADSHLAEVRDRALIVGRTTDASLTRRVVVETDATDVMILSSAALDDLGPSRLDELHDLGATVVMRVTARETLFGLQRLREVGGMPFVLLERHTLPASRARLKRLLELLLLLAFVPVWLPAVGVVALYVRWMAGAPVLFWQERVGAGGAPFQMVKFRTMHVNAEEDGAPQLAQRTDPRVVHGLQPLRDMRLDELPQILNVIRGEMSLVGPRPERPEFTQRFQAVIPGYSRRHELAPGMTGLAQIQGRYDTDPEYKLGYDLQYLVNWSPVLDLEILARTVWVVLSRRI